MRYKDHESGHACCVLHLQGSTFGIPGVEQYAHFLRDVRHAEAIRARLIENIALAGVPGEGREGLQGAQALK